MNESQNNLRPNTNRDHLDADLVLERNKSTTTIFDFLSRIEKQTQSTIAGSRKATDLALLDSRDKIDEHILVGTVIAEERSQMDLLMTQERKQRMTTASQIIQTEREMTDINLSVERARMDTEILQTSSLLTSEINEHIKTKVSLTTRDEFLAIVSHDLRNPIGAVSSCAQMLLDDPAYQEMDSDVTQWIQFMKRNADTALRLINDLLDMERIHEGKIHLNQSTWDINQIIKESVESLVYSAAAKNILLRIPAFDNSNLIACDRDRILQVLSNLISNALKFTPEGGSVVLNSKVKNNFVEICIHDTGPGIPAEKQATIFERFTQLQSKDRRGLGLGLYISKMLIESHRGKIWVESELGHGSTFFFSLPMKVA